MRRTALVPAFAAWTLLIWGSRIGNIWRDQDLDAGARMGRTALAATFVAGGAVVAAAWWRGRGGTLTRATLTRATLALAAWTGVVWVIRAAAIVAGDWSTGFKVVHTLLAVASVALAALAVRELRGAGDPSDRRTRADAGTGREDRPPVPG